MICSPDDQYCSVSDGIHVATVSALGLSFQQAPRRPRLLAGKTFTVSGL